MTNENRGKWMQLALQIYAFAMMGSMATMSLGLGLLIVVALWEWRGPAALFSELRNTVKIPAVRKYLIATHLLTGACVLSLLAAKFYPLVIDGQKPEVKFVKDLWKAWYFYWPIALYTFLNLLTPARREKVIRTWLVAFVTLSLLGIFQFFVGWPRRLTLDISEEYFQVHGFTGSRLSYSSMVVFPLFYLIDFCLRENRKNLKILAVVGSLIGITALFGTFSRMVWIALPVCIFLYLILRLRKVARAATIAVVLLICAGVASVPSVRFRMTQAGGTSERFALWKINTEFFKARPITGVGWHHNLPMSAAYYREHTAEYPQPFVGHAHSNFFEWLGALGILGVLAGLYWSLITLQTAYRANLGLFCGWIAFHINGLTQVNFWDSKVIHSMMWAVAISLIYQSRDQLQSHESNITTS